MSTSGRGIAAFFAGGRAVEEDDALPPAFVGVAPPLAEGAVSSVMISSVYSRFDVKDIVATGFWAFLPGVIMVR
jgi:hypothetical protein